MKKRKAAKKKISLKDYTKRAEALKMIEIDSAASEIYGEFELNNLQVESKEEYIERYGTKKMQKGKKVSAV